MDNLTPEQLKKIQRLEKVVKSGDMGLLEHFDELESIEMYYENAESDLSQLENWAKIIDEQASHSSWYSK